MSCGDMLTFDQLCRQNLQLLLLNPSIRRCMGDGGISIRHISAFRSRAGASTRHAAVTVMSGPPLTSPQLPWRWSRHRILLQVQDEDPAARRVGRGPALRRRRWTAPQWPHQHIAGVPSLRRTSFGELIGGRIYAPGGYIVFGKVLVCLARMDFYIVFVFGGPRV